MPSYTIKGLTERDLELIGQGLGFLPFRDAALVVTKLKQQCSEQEAQWDTVWRSHLNAQQRLVEEKQRQAWAAQAAKEPGNG